MIDINKVIDARQEILTKTADDIWEYAEISMQEYRSAAALSALLANEGFIIEKNLCGIETAFSATYGSGGPVIGLLGEYDALDGLSQKAGSVVCEPNPSADNSGGHGCGHNLLGVGSAAAAIAVKEYLKEKGQGTVIFFGCPGEEGLASKTIMAKNGMFQKLDAAFCWHPGFLNAVSVGAHQASIQVEYCFRGVSSHAAESAFNGRSALDAAELMNMGVQFLREHIPSTDALHYAFTDVGGVSPNVVQAHSSVMYMLRSDTVRNAKKLLKRVNKIAEGAALMTETQMESRLIDGTSNMVSNSQLEKVLYTNLKKAALPVYTEEELSYAQKLFDSYREMQSVSVFPELSAEETAAAKKLTDGWKKPLNRFIFPYEHGDFYTTGSTDVGDVSWNTPTAQITAVTWTSLAPGHSWQNVSVGKTSVAHKGMLFAAKVLAMSVTELFENPRLIDLAKKEFATKAAGGYDCPLDD